MATTRRALCGVLAVAGMVGAAPAHASVRFMVKGDWGFGGPDQAKVTAQMCALHARRPQAFVLTTGDNFYNPDGVANDANFTRPEQCLRDAGLPWRAAWGNHDLGGDATAQMLASPRRYYRFRAGPALVVVLDANRPEDAAQRRFLDRALRTRLPVRIVVFHQPAYTAGLHPPGEVQQREWVPLFAQHRVSLVLQGHNHAYERIERDGVTYITTGGGGAPVYPCVRPFTEGLRQCRPVHHFLELTVARQRVVVRAIAATGKRLESVVVPAR